MTASSYRIVVCASGGGGNFQALIDARASLGVEIARLVVDRPCGAVERAISHGIGYVVLGAGRGRDAMSAEFEAAIPPRTDLIVLAGFMPIIPEATCEKWRGRMINTHPSLLPKYGGTGMYGVKVQEAVMRAKDTRAGGTVHFVSAGIDAGEIIVQESIEVDDSETPWQLGGRVFAVENRLVVEAVRRLKARGPTEPGA